MKKFTVLFLVFLAFGAANASAQEPCTGSLMNEDDFRVALGAVAWGVYSGTGENTLVQNVTEEVQFYIQGMNYGNTRCLERNDLTNIFLAVAGQMSQPQQPERMETLTCFYPSIPTMISSGILLDGETKILAISYLDANNTNQLLIMRGWASSEDAEFCTIVEDLPKIMVAFPTIRITGSIEVNYLPR